MNWVFILSFRVQYPCDSIAYFSTPWCNFVCFRMPGWKWWRTVAEVVYCATYKHQTIFYQKLLSYYMIHYIIYYTLGDWMLEIRNVKHSDAGDYECQVSSVFNPNCYHIKHNNKKDSKKINLNVKHFLLAIMSDRWTWLFTEVIFSGEHKSAAEAHRCTFCSR